MPNFNKLLLEMLQNATCSFTCIKYLKDILLKNNYQELQETDNWHITHGKYFIIRNDASLIAFNINKNKSDNFKIICTHSDTPSFLIKPNAEFFENGYQKLNVFPYGGILNYGFMDRPLSIAGRVMLKNGNSLKKEIIDVKDAIAVIPSLAIHQNSKANTNLNLNSALDLMPIISLDKNYNLKKILQTKLKLKNIYDYDLYLYNNELPHIINDEFLLSPRIDNITCTYAGFEAFLNNFSENINVFTVFNSEEIGSNTYEGADANFLIDTIKKICKAKNLDLTETLAKSYIISADNTHAMHPNHPEVADHTNTPSLNAGILITKEINGTTNAFTSSIFKYLCEQNNLPFTYYTSKNDLMGGSTQAGLSLRHLSVNSVDIALPMLAMHSGMELIGLKDIHTLYEAFLKFYQLNYTIKDNNIIF